MFAAGISLYLFYEFSRVKQAKQGERRERLNDIREQYLHQLIESRRKENGTMVDQPVTGQHEGEDEIDDSTSP